MTRDDIVQNWVDSSDGDFPVMESLFASGHYAWSLFLGHLVLEKLLKALYAKNVGTNVPRIHNLLNLAVGAGLELDDEQRLFLDKVTTFNMEARYPEQKLRFHKLATREFTVEYIGKIKECRQWLMQLLNGR